MINAVNGKLLYIRADKAIISTQLGIEYEIIISARTAATLLNFSEKEKEHVRLLTFLQHREDAMILFGFLTDEEKELYIELTKITGVGSKQALRILSGLSIKEFYDVLDTENVKALASIPGMGQKTAQKVILGLRNKLVPLQKSEKKPAASGSKTAFADVIDALVDMGFDKNDIIAAVQDASGKFAKGLDSLSPSERDELIFKETFKLLSKNE